MKLHIITIVLDGMQFITWHYPIFRQLPLDWHWWVIEGVAKPDKCTAWCADIPERLSRDGTWEYLDQLQTFDKRVHHVIDPCWPGKVAMFNWALSQIQDRDFLLMQIDSDEIWTAHQIEFACHRLSCDPVANAAFFHCRYFVGPDLIITSRNGFGNNDSYEWKRLWECERGARFVTHEPPKMTGEKEIISQEDTEEIGLVFDHFAYATEAQMKFKSVYYNSPRNPNGALYANAVEGWRRLQKAPMPVKSLSDYLPWVGQGVTVDRLDSSDLLK